MIKKPWKNDRLLDVIDDLWSGSLGDLAAELGVNRKVIYKLIAGEHTKEPLALLEDLHRVFQPKLKKFGLVLGLPDLRRSWRRTAEVANVEA
tara:strand:+ start:10154 stop:10429 length:276 start_codon:yes stop_codon:yes gene_type:complete